MEGEPSGCPCGSTLGVLRSLTGLLQTVLLGLLLAVVTGQEACLLQRRTLLGVKLGEGSGNAQTERTGLARNAAAVHGDVDVELISGFEGSEWLGGLHTEQFGWEVVGDVTAIDRYLAAAVAQANTGYGPLTTTGGLNQGLGHVEFLEFLDEMLCLGSRFAAGLWQFELDGLLGSMRMGWARVNLELGELLAAKAVLRKHAFHGLHDDLLWLGGKTLGERS
jgi:hypothetical protein